MTVKQRGASWLGSLGAVALAIFAKA